MFLHDIASLTDYRGLGTELSFEACETLRCQIVSTVDDSINEGSELETLLITLTLPPNLHNNIDLNPFAAELKIIDDINGS